MRDANRPVSSRRELFQNTGRLAAASALASVAIPSVHAAGTDLIQVALVGCGGRGTGAAANALSTPRAGPSSSSPWPTSSKTSSGGATRTFTATRI